MQKEKEKAMKDQDDKEARENLKKVEQEIDNQKYQQLVEMVQNANKTDTVEAQKKVKEAEEAKKKVEE